MTALYISNLTDRHTHHSESPLKEIWATGRENIAK